MQILEANPPEESRIISSSAYERLLKEISPLLKYHPNSELFERADLETVVNNISPEQADFIIGLHNSVVEEDPRGTPLTGGHAPLIELLHATDNIIRCRGKKAFSRIYEQAQKIAAEDPNKALQSIRSAGSIGNVLSYIDKKLEEVLSKYGQRSSLYVLHNCIGDFLKENKILLMPSDPIENPCSIDISLNELKGGMGAKATIAVSANAPGDNEKLNIVLKIEKCKEAALLIKALYEHGGSSNVDFPKIIGMDENAVLYAYVYGENAYHLLTSDRLKTEEKEILLRKIIDAVEDMHSIYGEVLPDTKTKPWYVGEETLEEFYTRKDKAKSKFTINTFNELGLDLKSREFQDAEDYAARFGEKVFSADAKLVHFRVKLNPEIELSEIVKLDENMKRLVNGPYGDWAYMNYLSSLPEDLRNLAEKIMIEKRMKARGTSYEQEFDALNIVTGLECLRNAATLSQQGLKRDYLKEMGHVKSHFDRLSENFSGLREKFQNWHKAYIAQLN